jgi:hypothetical protein
VRRSTSWCCGWTDNCPQPVSPHREPAQLDTVREA